MGMSLGEVSVSIGADISSFTRNMSVVADSMKSFQKASSNVTSGVQKVAQQATGAISGVGKFGSSLIQGAKGAVDFASKLGLGIMGLKATAEGAMGFANALIQPNAQLEQTQIAFTQMLGSGKKAQAFLKDLQNFANQSPFEFNDLTDASKHLLAFGFQAKDVIPMMTSIGDATSALGAGQDGIDRVTTALGQMRAAGKLNANDMMQLTSVGIPAWQILASQMHLSVAQVQQLSQQGKIASDKVIPMLIAGMEKAYGGQMASQAKSFNGIVSNLADVWSTLARTLTKPIFDEAKKGLQVVAGWMSSKAFSDFVQMMGVQIAGAMDTASKFIDSNLKPAFLWLVDFFQKFNTQILNDEPIGLFIGSIQNLGDAIGGALMPLLQPLIDLLGPQLSGPALTTQQAVDGISQAMTDVQTVLDGLSSGIRNLTAFFQSNSIQAQAVKDLLLGIGVAIGTIQLGALLMALPEMIAGFTAWAVEAGIAAVETIIGMAPIILIGAGIALVVAAIVLAIQHWGDITKWLGNIWASFSGWFMGLLGGIGAWFTGIWQSIASFFVGIWSSIVGAVTTAGAAIAGAWQVVVSAIVGAWNTVVTIVSGVLQTIIAAVIAWVVGVATAIANNPFVQYVTAVFVTINNIINALLRIAFTFIAGIFVGIYNTIAGALTSVYNVIATKVGEAVKWLATQWTAMSNTAKVYWAMFQVYIAYYLALAQAKINEVIGAIVRWLSDRWNEIAGTVRAVWAVIVGVVSSVWNTIYTYVSSGINRAAAYLSGKWNEIKANVMGVWNAITSTVGRAWDTLVKNATDRVNAVKTNVFNVFNAMKDGIGGIIKGFVNNLISGLNLGITGAEGFVNGFGGALNWVADKLGTKGVIPTVHFPRIPMYAAGTGYHPGGPAIVGEVGRELAMINGNLAMLGANGPQLVDLPRGSSVLPNGQTEALLSSGLVPGYAGGIGDFFSWIGGGAKSILDNVLGMFGISGIQMPGVLTQLAGGMFTKAKDLALNWISNILPKFDMGGTAGVPGSVTSWIEQAMMLTRVPGNWLGPLAAIAMHESGGNPMAINDWDINAKNGDPSRGLFQTIGATFAAYALPGHGSIYNPVDNAAAAIRYIQSRYGSVFNVPGITSMASGGGYVGYANGGVINEPIVGMGLTSGKRYAFGEREAEAIVPLSKAGGAGNGKTINITVELDSRVIAKATAPAIVNEFRLKTGNRS